MPRNKVNNDRVKLVIEWSLRIEKSDRKVGLFQQTVVIIGLAMRPFKVVKKFVQIGLLKQRFAPVYELP